MAVNTWAADGGTNALLTNSPVLVKTGIVYVTGVAIWNSNGADVWVQAFDVAAASSVTLGTTNPKFAWRVPGGATNNAGAWEEKFVPGAELIFSNGVVLAATTAMPGSSAPANSIQLNLEFRP